MSDILALVREFGMQAVITIAILWGGWQLVCFMMRMMEEANKRWQEIFEKLEARFRQFQEESKEAHQYQRNEHEKLSAQQDKQIIQQDKQIGILDGIEKAVGRINGYGDGKH